MGFFFFWSIQNDKRNDKSRLEMMITVNKMLVMTVNKMLVMMVNKILVMMKNTRFSHLNNRTKAD